MMTKCHSQRLGNVVFCGPRNPSGSQSVVTDGFEPKSVECGSPSEGCVPFNLADSVQLHSFGGGHQLIENRKESWIDWLRECLAAFNDDIRILNCSQIEPDAFQGDLALAKPACLVKAKVERHFLPMALGLFEVLRNPANLLIAPKFFSRGSIFFEAQPRKWIGVDVPHMDSFCQDHRHDFDFLNGGVASRGPRVVGRWIRPGAPQKVALGKIPLDCSSRFTLLGNEKRFDVSPASFVRLKRGLFVSVLKGQPGNNPFGKIRSVADLMGKLQFGFSSGEKFGLAAIPNVVLSIFRRGRNPFPPIVAITNPNPRAVFSYVDRGHKTVTRRSKRSLQKRAKQSKMKQKQPRKGKKTHGCPSIGSGFESQSTQLLPCKSGTYATRRSKTVTKFPVYRGETQGGCHVAS